MKKIIGMAIIATICAAPVFAAPRQSAGGPGQDPSSIGMGRIAKILGDKSLSATIVMTVTEKKKKPNPPMEMKMVIAGGKCRMEMNMAKSLAAENKEENFDASEFAAGSMVVISRPDRNLYYQLMPSAKAYCQMAMPESAGGKNAKEQQVERKVEGKEIVEGYECQKVFNTITADDGSKYIVYSWEADKLGGIPVKVQTQLPNGEAVMIFKDIKIGKQDASLFEPPAGYKKYNSYMEMLMSGIMDMMAPNQ